MSKYLNKLLYGKMEQRHIIVNALGIPADTEVLDDDAKAFPHFAIKDDVFWLWSVVNQEWQQLVPDSLVDTRTFVADDVYTLVDGFQIWKITFKPDDDCTLKIGFTPGGEEIMIAKDMTGGTWDVINYDVFTQGADRTIYFTGIVGLAIFKIHKLVL